MKRLKLFEDFNINESTETDAQQIKDIMSAGTAFLSLREPLKKAGFMVDFSFDPQAHYVVKKKGGKSFIIINKKYVDKPDFVHGDIAMGLMESEISEKEKSFKEIENEKKALLDKGMYDMYLAPEKKITKMLRSVSSEASPWIERVNDTSIRIYVTSDREAYDELEFLAKEMGLIKQDLNSEEVNEQQLLPNSALSGTEWKLWEEEELPEHIGKILDAKRAFAGGGGWCTGAAFYKGDPKTSTDWIVVTDNGGYFKVGAEFMVWYKPESKEEYGAQAVWSVSHLKKTLKSLFKTGKTIPDPGYQT